MKESMAMMAFMVVDVGYAIVECAKIRFFEIKTNCVK